jgi:glycosyltransferase involved in cell wall biosynthesis
MLMNERIVLIIAYYFPPMGLSGVQRIVKFVKYLPEFGWKPLILTDTPSSFYAFDETLFLDLTNPSIEIFRTPGKKVLADTQKPKTVKLPSYTIQKFGRALLQFFYQPDSKIKWKNKAITVGRRLLSKYKVDVIYATAPPYTDFLIANELSKEFDIPFIIDYRDPWIDNPFHFYATPFHKSYSVGLEREILTHANKAVVVSRGIKEQLVKRYGFLSHSDITIISHGYDPDDFNQLAHIKPNPYKFTITHSGVFQDNRTPKYFLKALASFINKNPNTRNEIEARFVGVMRKSHKKLIKRYGLTNNVIMTGYVSHLENVRHLLESDVLWLMQKDLARTPGKLYEYFGAAKPILVSVPEGILKKLALETNAAIATAPDDINAIEKAIATFYNLWKNNNLPKPKAEFIQQFDRRSLTAELARELELAREI